MSFTRTFAAREDSGSANNPALNLTGAPAVEVTFVNEDINGNTGDMIMDAPSGGGPDPDTTAVIDGVSYEFTFELSGTLPTRNNQGAGQVPDQYEGSVVYIVTILDYPSPGENTRLAFMPDEDATLAEMDSFGNGAIRVQNVSTTPSGEAVCLAEGTLVDTPLGARKIETLRIGDLVSSPMHGPLPIIHITRSAHNWTADPHPAKPVLISEGALGAGRPNRDLIVSPQHRIVVQHPGATLVPACGLVGLPGVRQMHGRRQAVYYNLLLERHTTLTVSGTQCESLYPGPMTLRSLAPQDRNALQVALARLAQPKQKDYGPLCLPEIRKQEALVRFRKTPNRKAA